VYPLFEGAAGRLECLYAGHGWSDIYRVSARDPLTGALRRYFLKVYACNWRTESDVLFELDFIRHLDRKGISAALPLAGRNGEAVQWLELPEGRRCFVLSAAARGLPLAEQPDDVQARLLGCLAARLHEAAADFSSPHRRASLEVDRLLDLSPLEAFECPDDEGPTRVRRAAARVRKFLKALPLSALERGVCHGDLGGRNVFLDGGPEGQATVIDFDDCGPGYLAYDLGHVLMFFRLFRAGEADRLWKLFLESYESRRRLPRADLAAAPAFALARLLQVHAHDNPVGAARDRWPATGYADGTFWVWLLEAVHTLEAGLLE
jgi:Ser/Thr protein kinase RdoA (MazF antagonist)